jgi:Gamma-glutamyl cyclotransferase, AIG2-like
VHLIFTYGTLRDPAVQRSLFGRLVPSEDDSMPGFRLDYVTITDPVVIAASGTARHRILRPGTDVDVIDGACLELTDEELAAADRYEVDDYVRVQVTLSSGRRAWVYVSADSPVGPGCAG